MSSNEDDPLDWFNCFPAFDFDFTTSSSTFGTFDELSLAHSMGVHDKQDLFVAPALLSHVASSVCRGNDTRIHCKEDHHSLIFDKAVPAPKCAPWKNETQASRWSPGLSVSITQPLSCVEQPLFGSPRPLALHVKPRIRRRKVGLGNKNSLGGRPLNVISEGGLIAITLTPETLRGCFGMPLHEAARTLGICTTAVKKCCRKMGIEQWPFQRIKPIRTRLARMRSVPMTYEIQLEIERLQAEEAALMQGRGLSCLDPRT